MCPSLRSVAAVLRKLCARGDVDIVRVKERFLATPSGGGWRDCMVCFAVRSNSNSGSSSSSCSGGNSGDAGHVCELQIVHADMLTPRKGLPGHAVYVRCC